MRNVAILGFLTIFLVNFFPSISYGQLNNKPFSFKTPGGNVGMSIGGRQAILNKKILGVTPRNLVRGASGQLLDVVRGPGHSAIVSAEGGGTIPSFRGRSYKGNNTNMAAGVFNAYFSPSGGGSSSSPSVRITSSDVVSTWTTRVATGGIPVSFSPGSTVDSWTGQVY